jgi:cbb3-type cytochrome oxidase subunit 3
MSSVEVVWLGLALAGAAAVALLAWAFSAERKAKRQRAAWAEELDERWRASQGLKP